MSVSKSMPISLLVVVVFAAYSSAGDPCQDGNFFYLDNVSKRSPTYDMDSTPLCDRYITEGWYRASKFHVMSTSAPILGKCGTLYPVWLKDTIPNDGNIHTLTACEVGFSETCGRTYYIDVKSCTGFLLYYLKPLDVCNSAYCFELNDDCVNVSIPDIRLAFHNITWTITETHVKNVSIKRYDPSVNLICSFTPSDDDTLLYHIDWYVDNETVIQGQTVDKSSLDDAILSAADLNKTGKKINSWIHCVVGAKKSKDKFPCFSHSSNLFFAGIKILNQTLTIQRKQSETLMLRTTIPFAAETIRINSSYMSSNLNVQLSFPGNTEEKCRKDVTGSVKVCSISIKSYTYQNKHKYEDPSNWDKIYTLEVFNLDDEGYYLKNNRLVLRLETNKAAGTGAKIFSEVLFHDININVVDNKEAWKGKRCSAYADPHLTTFDGYKYECQDTGCIINKTYIFYRNIDHLQEVQVRHENCWGRPRCVCAVAARSGQDVFTIDVCDGRQYINFPLCNEHSLKVIKETDIVYKIIFPTGTFVKVLLYNFGSSSFYINLEVYPTVADVGKTSGLCGVLDNDRTNDLLRRDRTNDNINFYSNNKPPDDFSLSWQLPSGSTEDLLSKSQAVFDNLTPLSSYFSKLCTCDKGQTVCSYKQYTECKTNVKGKEYHCVLHSSSRKKRDLNLLPRIQGTYPTLEVHDRVKRQAINEDDAFNICDAAFQQSPHYKTCLQVVPTFSNDTLVNCIRDLTMTGNRNLTKLHIDTALGQCQSYILLNSTLEHEHPDVVSIIINLCPNNCSDKGVCSKGKCACDHGFGGSDCSFNVLSPPTITRLSGDGVCDKSSESCDDITVYGHYFLENMGTTCHMTREEINENGTVTTVSTYEVRLKERTLFEGYCTLEFSDKLSWMTVVQFNLTTDGGRHYSKNYTLHIYQSVCQNIHDEFGIISTSLKGSYCFLHGSCIKAGTFKNNDTCLQCVPSLNAFDWTFDCKQVESIGTMAPITTTNIIDFSTTPRTTVGVQKLKNHKDERHNTAPDSLTIGLIAAAIVVIGMSVTAGYMIKTRVFKRMVEKSATKASVQEEINSERNDMKTSTSKANILQFDSSDNICSRPPSSVSLEQLAPTNDLRGLYHQQHLDELFVVDK